MKRRLLSTVLALALLLSILPGQIFARENRTVGAENILPSPKSEESGPLAVLHMEAPAKNMSAVHEHPLSAKDEETVSFTETLTAADLVLQQGKVTLSAGSYVLGEDISTETIGMLYVSGKVSLCLAGHDLDLGNTFIQFSGKNSTLQICDCAQEAKGQIRTVSTTGAILINSGHTLELYGVSLFSTSHGVNSQGGTVKVYDSTIAVENMAQKNSAYAILASGGSVLVDNSLLTAQAASAAFPVNAMNKCLVELKNSTLHAKAKANSFGLLSTSNSVVTMENCDLVGECPDITGVSMGANSCGDLTARNCRFTACGSGNNIFGFYSYGEVTATLTDCTVTADTQNTGSATAMGVNNSTGVLTMDNCTIRSDGAEGRYSFGIYNTGKLYMNNCSATAVGTGTEVYGLYNCGSVELGGEITLDGAVADIALSTDTSLTPFGAKYITLTAPLSGEDRYSVYTYADVTASQPQMIVKGWAEHGTGSIPFYSVNSDYSVDEMDGALYLTAYHRHSLREGEGEAVIFSKTLTAADLTLQQGKVTLSEGTYVLREDISTEKIGMLYVSGKVSLCLAGHDLDLGNSFIQFSGKNSTLQICDCAQEEKGQIRTVSTTGAVLINGGHTLELYGVSLFSASHGVNSQGGTVKVYDSTIAVENMAQKNSAYAILASGGSVLADNCLLTAQADSAAFPVNAMNKCLVELKNSTLHAKAKANSFGLLSTANSVVTMENCDLVGECLEITGVAMGANSCGDLIARSCSFTACGSGNNLFGLYSYGDVTATLTDCTVITDSQNTGNTTAMGVNNGSGVLTMDNCTIRSDGAEGRYSFGIYNTGKLYMNNCSATAVGTGTEVYGLYNCGSVELGGEITLDGAVADIALSTDSTLNPVGNKYITLTAPLTGGDSYSVYTYAEPTADCPRLIVKGWAEYGTDTVPFHSASEGFAVEERVSEEGERNLYMVLSAYGITAEEATGGSLKLNAEQGLPGEEIRIDAEAVEGHLLQELTAVYQSPLGEEISLAIASHTENGKVYYTFTMPQAEVLVSARFEKKALKFRSISLSLESSIGMNFYIADSTLEGYSDIYVVVEKELYDEVGNLLEEREATTLTEYDTVLIGGASAHHYSYNEITAKEMSSKVYITAYATVNGILVAGETREYSVVQYATNMIKGVQSPALHTLLVDLLNYGTLAQQVFNYNNKAENFANASEIVQAAQIHATQTMPEIKSYATDNKNTCDSLSVTISAISLSLEDRVEMNFYLGAASEKDLEDLQFVVTYQDKDGEPVRTAISAESFAYDASTGYYKVNFTDLNATDMRTVITARLENGQGQVVSNTRTYSIESYACSTLKQEAASQIIKDLLVSMMKYGDATLAYFSES